MHTILRSLAAGLRSQAVVAALALAAGAAALAPSAAQAQAAGYPAKPIRLVIGFAAGGPTDSLLRLVAQDMGTTLGQTVFVENKPGANSLIASSEVSRAAPDGYTLLGSTLADNVNAILMPERAKRAARDFEPVGLAATVPMIAVTGYESPIQSIADAVARAKAQPGGVTYGSAGNGGSAHLAGALLQTRSGTDMTHVPFKGNAPALSEVMAGRVSFMFYPTVGVRDLVQQKRVRALGVSTPQRHPDFPDVPTLAEAGFPGFDEYTPGIGLLAPLGTDKAVVAKLNQAMRAAIAKPEISARFRALGAVPAANSPDEFRAWLQKDYERWERVIKAAGVKAE